MTISSGSQDGALVQVLTGDMLLAAAFVSYAGPFTSKFRALLIADWIRFLREKGAPMTPGITDPLKVQSHPSSFPPTLRGSPLRLLLVIRTQAGHLPVMKASCMSDCSACDTIS